MSGSPQEVLRVSVLVGFPNVWGNMFAIPYGDGSDFLPFSVSLTQRC